MAATETQASLLSQLIDLHEERLSMAQDANKEDKDAVSQDDILLLRIAVTEARLELARYVESKEVKGVC